MKFYHIKYKTISSIEYFLAFLLTTYSGDLLAGPHGYSTSCCGLYSDLIPGFYFNNFPADSTTLGADTVPLFHMKIGGEIRTRYEKYWNDNWGAAPKDYNGYFLHRFLLFADLPVGNKFHVIAELKSALHSDLDIPPRPVDEDKLDFQKLLVELAFTMKKDFSGIIRVGRQEFEPGSKRLINKREYTNALLSFDGLSFMAQKNNALLTAFGLLQSRMSFGVFDNRPDPDRGLWGAMYTSSVPGKLFGNLDAYYIGFFRRQISYNVKDFVNFYDQGPYHENRETLGVRLFGASRKIDYDLETMYQLGEYSRDESRIRAWRLAVSFGDTLTWQRRGMRLYMNADLSSGDRDSTDKIINTFISPYPDILDPTASNLSGFRIGFNYFLGSRGSIDISEWLFYRTSTHDGVYGFLGFPYRPAGNSHISYLGNSPTVLIQWNISQKVALTALYATEFVGNGFFQSEKPGLDLSYAGLGMTFKY